MKKILVLACISLISSVFGQSADKSEVDKLRHAIKIVQAENNKLKNELRDSINYINESLENLKKLYKTTNSEIKTDENSLGITTSSLAQLNDYTLTKFTRHRRIIKTAIALGLLAIFLAGVMTVLLYLKTRQNFNQITKNYDLNLTALRSTADDIDKKINISNEIFDAKINDTRKMFINDTRDLKNSCESLVNKVKEELKKDIAYSSQLGFSQLTEAKKETSEHLNIQNERLNFCEKILKDKK